MFRYRICGAALMAGVAGSTMGLGAVFSSPLSAAELKQKFGQWGLYCASQSGKPSPQDCALAIAVVAKEDSKLVARLGVAVVDETGEIEITIKIPTIKYIGSGVIVSSLQGQILRAFFDECADGGCTSTVRLDSLSLQAMLTTDDAWVEYQIKDDQTIRLPLSFASFGEAVTILYNSVGVGRSGDSFATASTTTGDIKDAPATRVLVEIRESPTTGGRTALGEVANCKSATPKKVVSVTSTFEITDRDDVADWIADATPCINGSVLYIKPADSQKSDSGTVSFVSRVQAFQVYEMLRESGRAKDIVFAGQSAVSPTPQGR